MFPPNLNITHYFLSTKFLFSYLDRFDFKIAPFKILKFTKYSIKNNHNYLKQKL